LNEDILKCNPEDLVGLTLEELADCKSTALNKILKKRSISKERSREIKALRRRLRNRTHAKTQRMKKESEFEDQSCVNELRRKHIEEYQARLQEQEEKQKILKDILDKINSDVEALKQEEQAEAAKKKEEEQSQISALLAKRPGLIIENVKD